MNGRPAVTFITGSFLPQLGGMELHVRALARELVERGWAARVVAPRVPGAPEREVMEGIEVRRAAWPELLTGRALPPADVYHVHGSRKVFSALGLLRASLRGRPVVFTPHCFYPAWSWTGRVKRWAFDPVLGRPQLRCSHVILALTERDRQDAVRLGARPERIRICPNAVDLERLDAVSPDPAWPRRWGLGPFVLFTGRLDRVKRVDFLIDAAPALRERGLSLLVIGEDAGEERSLRARAAARGVQDVVRFAGRVPYADLVQAYHHCRACVLPSRYEGLPTSVLEAMALGRPVVAAATGGTPYVIEDGRTGFLFPYGDTAAFLAALDRALGADGALGLRARAAVRERYGWERVAAEVLAVYRDLVSPRGLPRPVREGAGGEGGGPWA